MVSNFQFLKLILYSSNIINYLGSIMTHMAAFLTFKGEEKQRILAHLITAHLQNDIQKTIQMLPNLRSSSSNLIFAQNTSICRVFLHTQNVNAVYNLAFTSSIFIAS